MNSSYAIVTVAMYDVYVKWRYIAICVGTGLLYLFTHYAMLQCS